MNREIEEELKELNKIGNLNILILKFLTSSGLVDSSLKGKKAQAIVDKIDELSKIILE